MVKQCIFGPTISAIPPKKYAERFVDFIEHKLLNVLESPDEELEENQA